VKTSLPLIAAIVGLAALMAGQAPAQTVQPIPAPIAVALADPLRPQVDRARDPARRAGETLAFAGVAPGQSIAELFPGGGYFTRLLSKTVGRTGRIYVLPWGEPNTGGSRRMAADPAYGNITAFLENPVGFRPPAPLDMVFTSQNYHDIQSPQRPQVNQAVFKALKPGGVYLILDHAAVLGSGYATLPLHRIDEALVKKELAQAGFVLAAESDILRNPADDRRLNVFDPAIRGATDQFILKFVKPLSAPAPGQPNGAGR
jgi:predicted methyltransferase